MKKFLLKGSSGQGAIEYLLIIAAAILVVAIVILAVTGALSGGQEQGEQALTSQENAMSALDIQRRLAAGEIQIASIEDIPAFDEWIDGQNYFLSKDITSTATDESAIRMVNTTNVTIDCLGHTITSSNTGSAPPAFGYAVFINISEGIVLKNCNINAKTAGIVLSGSGTPTNPIQTENITINVDDPAQVGISHQSGTIVKHKNLTSCSSTTKGIICNLNLSQNTLHLENVKGTFNTNGLTKCTLDEQIQSC